jgi:exodeoxyribonuclease VII small subunit
LRIELHGAAKPRVGWELKVGKKKPSDEAELCFEDALQELESIVGKLEGGKLGLEQSLEHYEQGVQHLKQCYQLLRHAERKIELVSGLDAAGNAKTVTLNDDDDSSLAAKGDARSRRRSASGERSGAKRPGAGEVDDESSLF